MTSSDNTPPQSSWRPPSPVSDYAEEKAGKIASRHLPPPVSKAPAVSNAEPPYPTPESTPLPETPPRPTRQLRLANEPTEVIDLTEPTPEPSPKRVPQTIVHVKHSQQQQKQLPTPPPSQKNAAYSTRLWRPLSEVLEEQKAASSSGSSTSGASSNSSFDSSTAATSDTSLTLKPPSPLITDPNTHVSPGLRTPKKRIASPGPSRRPWRDGKRHIHADKHKRQVAMVLQELKNQAFVKKRRRGYTGTKIDLEETFRYASEVREVIPETAVISKFEWEEGYWRKIIDNTHKAPIIKPYTPALDEVGKKIRDHNRLLDEWQKRSLRDSLPPDEDAQVSKILRTRGVISKCAREQVSDQDIHRLGPAQWLNDEIINFYGAMINARSDDKQAKVKHGEVLKVFYLSTFFWEKLFKEGYEKGRLAKWTKKVDIFAKDIILIPVNHSNRHWTAAAINFKHKRIESYDSMNMAGPDVCRRLRQYVEQEHQNKKKKPFDWTGWADFIDSDHPQQENGYDCGVFTCQTLESLSRGETSRVFTQANMPYIRRKMIWEIANARLRDDDFS